MKGKKEYIELLSNNLAEVITKLRQAEDKVECLERRSRGDNVTLCAMQRQTVRGKSWTSSVKVCLDD